MKFCKGCNAWIGDEEVDYIYGKDNLLKETICGRCASTIKFETKSKKSSTTHPEEK